MLRVRIIMLAFALIPLTSCTSHTSDQAALVDPAQEEADRQAIEHVNELWERAERAGDVEAISGLITDDYIRMNPDTPMTLGKEAFLEQVRPFFESFAIQETNVASEEIRIAGDWAYVRGIYSGTIVLKAGGEPVSLDGKWIDIRERQTDGTWKISRASFSTDRPLNLPE